MKKKYTHPLLSKGPNTDFSNSNIYNILQELYFSNKRLKQFQQKEIYYNDFKY